jgi:hypothetical protein
VADLGEHAASDHTDIARADYRNMHATSPPAFLRSPAAVSRSTTSAAQRQQMSRERQDDIQCRLTPVHASVT